MDYEDKLKSLLRELELAQRKKPDPRIFEGPDKGGLWRKIFSGRPRSEALAAKDRWANHILDALYPPPLTNEELRLDEQNRTLEEIKADIDAIPPVSVHQRVYAPNCLPTAEGKVIVMGEIKKEPHAFSGRPKIRDKYQIQVKNHPSAFEGLARALRSEVANRQTKLSIEEDGRRFPVRSQSSFIEEQNHDTALRADLDGRHFCLKLVLSKPLFAALQECLPRPASCRPYSKATCFVVYVPIDHDDTPRDVPYRSKTPYIKFPEVRLTRLHVAELSSCAKDAQLLKVIRLTECD